MKKTISKSLTILLLLGLIALSTSAQKIEWKKSYDDVVRGTTIHYVGKNKYGDLFRDGADKYVRSLSYKDKIGFFYVNDKQEIVNPSKLVNCPGEIKFAKITDETISIVTMHRPNRECTIAYTIFDAKTFEEIRTEVLMTETVRYVENFSLNFAESEDKSKIMMSWLQVNKMSNQGELVFKVFNPSFDLIWETSFYPKLNVRSSMLSMHDFAIANDGQIIALFSSYFEQDKKTNNNFYFHISKLNANGSTTSSVKMRRAEVPSYARAFVTSEGKIFIACYYAMQFASILYDLKNDRLIGYSESEAERSGYVKISDIVELPNGNIATIGYQYYIFGDNGWHYTNRFIYADIADKEANILKSYVFSRVNYLKAHAIIIPPFINYNIFTRGNDIFFLYSADLRDDVLLKTDEDKSRTLKVLKPKKGGMFMARIDENLQVSRKLMYNYKEDPLVFYPISYDIDKETLGIFKADNRVIKVGLLHIDL